MHSVVRYALGISCDIHPSRVHADAAAVPGDDCLKVIALDAAVDQPLAAARPKRVGKSMKFRANLLGPELQDIAITLIEDLYTAHIPLSAFFGAHT